MHIMHQFEIEDEKVWYISSATRENECLVEYKSLDDETNNESDDIDNMWVGPILEDYNNNNVRFVRLKSK